ncbi:CmcJ/NvfI family oxidoreductase [Sphingomonas profundi]|uniref:CmcJ/NvfI family oxidoreductase n=1 Tax=Alterirhizorhabdus profundi TaxID=2681549 RepID=UPI0012E74B46|nr:CmcJ/NvfI family oxidoreductase [Sphingomonas profundi]
MNVVDEAITVEIPYIATAEREIIFSSDPARQNFVIEPHSVAMRNGRCSSEPLSLDVQGFMLARWPSHLIAERGGELIAENSRPSETMGPASLAYLEEVAPLIQSISGAREIVAQYGFLTMRFSSRSPVQGWMSTAAMAHLDFTPGEVDRQLAQTLKVTGRRVAPFSRLKVIQTWRVTTPPPQDKPLAICDGRTVSPRDMVSMEFRGPDGSRDASVRSRGCLHSPDHRWYYFPNMVPDEVLVFKGFDSAAPEAMNAMHTAFEDHTRSDAVPRGSIECRFFALYD